MGYIFSLIFSPLDCMKTTLAALAAFLTFPALSASALEQEQVRVVGRKPVVSSSGDPLGFVSTVAPDVLAAPPRDLAELAVSLPGVSYTGQGGLFQTISVRGLSRARIGSFYLDIPILTERRAGTAASFIDPGLLASMEVIRGPATTHYGSGNIGGLLAMQPSKTVGTRLQLGLGSEASQNYQLLALGDEDRKVIVTHRGANDGDSAAGMPLHTEFDQYNLMLDYDTDNGDLNWGVNTLFSYGEDIGKSNKLYPDMRLTDYPRERHWLGQLDLAHADVWQGSVYFHYQDLETSVRRLGLRRNEVDSQSLDVGTRWLADFGSRDRPLRVGADWLGRFGVKADETETRYADNSVSHRDNLDADQQELAIFADSSRELGEVLITGGLRATLVWQDADDYSSESEAFVSAFAGASWSFSERLQLSAELVRGDRAPSLSERFFNGTTGRSQVLGNPDLDREKVTSVDLGGLWQGDRLRLELHAYYQDLDDFIERVQLAPQLLGFDNISGGEIYGSDVAFEYQVSAGWSLHGGGQLIDSEDHQGDPLQDVPADALSLGVRYQNRSWRAQLDYSHRFSDKDVAETEQAFDSARLLSAGLSWQISEDLSLGVWGRNLLDDEYVISGDSLSTEGEQRAFGVDLRWQQGETE